ncbi:MAG: OadG family protein [Sphaerochaeta sp.]
MNPVFQQSLTLMLKGMVGIFTVIILIYFVIVLLNQISKKEKPKNDQ